MRLQSWGVILVAVLCMAGLCQQPALSPGYDQRYRPQFHFSPQTHWTNDPNGVVYFDGEYHLFYQFNPFGDVWGHMSWGHAVSRDLMHWQELPVALPEEDGIMIFTGSTVVDERNTSGFCRDDKPCLVAAYTGHTPGTDGRRTLQTQNLAYSNDRGRTWTKFRGNPVLDLHRSDFRDPDVFWSDSAHRWMMAVAFPGEHKVLFYGSPDLKKWEKLSEFGPAGATGGAWECPTMAELPVQGSRQTRWVLKIGLNPGGLHGGSGEQYFVGTFDGSRFVNDNPASTTLWTDYGKDCYCALTFNGIERGRDPVMIGWMNNWQYADTVPTSPWRGQMTVPRTLALTAPASGSRLVQNPVAEVSQLRDQHIAWRGTKVAELNHALGAAHYDSLELQTTVERPRGVNFAWRLLAAGGGSFTEVGYDGSRGELFVDRKHSGITGFSPDFPGRTVAPLPPGDAPLRLTILVDRSTIEVFADGGRIAMTNLVYPREGAHGMEFSLIAGDPKQITVDLWSLRSTWSRSN